MHARRVLRPILVAVLMAATVGAGCGPSFAVAPPLTPTAQDVRIGKSDAAAGLKEIGPIEVVHGHGWGLLGARGTFEGAMILLRNEAADRGAAYVQLVTITEPHAVGAAGFDNRFVIRGLMFADPARR